MANICKRGTRLSKWRYDTRNNEIQRNDTQYNDLQNNNNQNVTLSMMKLSLMADYYHAECSV